MVRVSGCVQNLETDFPSTLFSNVHLESRGRFKRFSKLVTSVGHFIKELDFTKDVALSEHELEQLAARDRSASATPDI